MTKIQLRHDTAENWTTANPTLLAGEAGVETDTGKMKVGDGSTAWTDLTYVSGESIDAYTKAETDSLLEEKQDVLTAKDNIIITPKSTSLTLDWRDENGDIIDTSSNIIGTKTSTVYAYPFYNNSLSGKLYYTAYVHTSNIYYGNIYFTFQDINNSNNNLVLSLNHTNSSGEFYWALSETVEGTTSSLTLDGSNEMNDTYTWTVNITIDTSSNLFTLEYYRNSTIYTGTATLSLPSNFEPVLSCKVDLSSVPSSYSSYIYLTSLSSWTANNGSNKTTTIAATVPTKTSELTNDSGYITEVSTATTSSLGVVQPDGTTITIDDNGVISSSGGSSVTVDTTLDTSSNNPIANSTVATSVNSLESSISSLQTTVDSKQDTLTDSQLSAVNSGITSDKVTLIDTLDTEMTTAQTDITTLQTNVANKADSSNVVDLTSAQTISGKKTFSSQTAIYSLQTTNSSGFLVYDSANTRKLLQISASNLMTYGRCTYLGYNSGSNTYARLYGNVSGTDYQLINVNSSLLNVGNNSLPTSIYGTTLTLGNSSTTACVVTIGSAVNSIPIGGASLPSERYISLTIPDSSTLITASENGWLYCTGTSTSETGYLEIYRTNSLYGMRVNANSTESVCKILFPVRKSTEYCVKYSGVTLETLTFLYAGCAPAVSSS